MDSWGVETIHLNIDEGDSAVHILRDAQVVQSAVLIDGGLGTYGSKVIEGFMKSPLVKQNFKRPGAQDLKYFDALVVTHWDKDHAEGLYKTISNSLEYACRLYVSSNNIRDNNKFVQATVMPNLEIFAPMCLYDPATKLPKTVLYCPYWDPAAATTLTPDVKAVPNSKMDKIDYNGDQYIRFQVNFRFRFSKPAKSVDFTAAIPALKLGPLGKEMIGLDLFDGLSVLQPDLAKSPVEFSQALAKQVGRTKPAMVCIGCDSIQCDNKAAKSRDAMKWVDKDGNDEIDTMDFTKLRLVDPSTVFPGQKSLVSEDENADDEKLLNDGVSATTITGSTTGNNLASVACMVFWPDKKYARVTHYFAGDVGDLIEEKLLRWGTVEEGAGVRAPITVGAMKLSHHGSKLSTPVMMMFAWRPTYIFGSNGMNSGFNHVSWEILVLIKAYYIWKVLKMDPDSPIPLYCTNLPIYLCTYYNNPTVYADPGSVESIDSSKGARWRSALDNIRDLDWDLASQLPGKSTDVQEMKHEVVQLLSKEWDLFSAIPEGDYSTLSLTDKNIRHSKYQEVRAVGLSQESNSVLAGKLMGRTAESLGEPVYADEATEYVPGKRFKTSSLTRKVVRRSTSKIPLNDKTRANTVSRKRDLRPLGCFCSKAAFGVLTRDIDGVKDVNRPKALPLGRAFKSYPEVQPATSEDMSYLVSSDASVKGVSDPIHTATESNLDLFLGELRTGAIVFEARPSAESKMVMHHGSDETFQWLAETMGSFDDTSCRLGSTASFSGDKATIEAFEFSTKLRYAYSSTDRSKAPSKKFYDSVVVFRSVNNAFDFKIVDGAMWPRASAGEKSDVVGPALVLCGSLGPEPTVLGSTVTGKEIIEMLGFENSGAVSWLSLLTDFTLDCSEGQRNAMWFIPGSQFQTVLRLCFKPAEGPSSKNLLQKLLDTIEDAVGVKGKLTLNSAQIVAKKSWIRRGTASTTVEPELVIYTKLTLTSSGPPLDLDTAVVLTPTSFQWIMTFDPTDNGISLPDLFTVISSFFSTEDFPNLASYLPGAENIAVRRVSFASQQQTPTTSRKWLDVTLQVSFADMALLCTLKAVFDGASKPSFTLCGTMFPENRPEKRGSQFSFIPYMPEYEPWTRLEISPVKNGDELVEVKGSDVADLGVVYGTVAKDQVGEAATLAPGPFDLQLAALDFVLSGDEVSFNATITTSEPDPKQSKVPVIRLLSASLSLRYNFGQGEPKTLPDMSLSTAIAMTAPSYPNELSAKWYLTVTYTSPIWEVSGGISGLSGGLLYSLFESDCDVEMMQLLSNVVLDLDLLYTYATDGTGSHFTIGGTLHLGGLQLTCTYTHDGGLGNWSFFATLSAGTSSLIDIVSSICGKDLAMMLPECVKNVAVEPKGKASLTSFKVFNSKTHMIILVRLQITTSASIAFYQIQEKRINPKPGDTSAPPTKRILLFSLDELPQVPEIPLMGSLKQPVDELRFCWVSSSSDKAGDVNSKGLTGKEVEAINTTLTSEYPRLAFKNVTKGDTGDIVVIGSGFHFCVMQGESVMLDYAFGGPKDNAKTSEADNDINATAMVAVNKVVGPVTIDRVGLDFATSTETLTLVIDGTLKLGPIEMSLVGFSVSFGLKDASLRNLAKVSTSFSLQGLAIAYDKAPLTIAGFFQHSQIGKSDFYMGGAVVGFAPWQLEAGGYYGTTTVDPPKEMIARRRSRIITVAEAVALEEEFKSFFAYVKLNGPLATIGYVEIRGLVGGFGYNTSVTFPSVENVVQFPFLNPPSGNSPSKALTAMLQGGWFANKKGANWVAAGLTILAFALLDVSAVVVLQWGSGVKLGIFALATAEMPKESEKKFLRVQLGLTATVDFDAGIMKIDGQLTPASFILDPACQLTGGFALYSWFGSANQAQQGDWVFTIGGYHAAYVKPELYPRPPRLGISWSYDKNINIKGQSYFALTPAACMGGGSLKVTLTLGNLYAYFEAYADFLINYRPFTYQAEGGVTVGVRYTIDLWLISGTIGVDLGARIFLKGPALSGKVHVDFYVFGFDVAFGAQNSNANNKLSLPEFYKLVLQSSKSGAAGMHAICQEDRENAEEDAATVDDLQPHVLTCISGLVPPEQGKSDSTFRSSADDEGRWKVRGPVFAFQVMCKFAASEAKVLTCSTDECVKPSEFKVPNNASGTIYSKPMQLMKPLGQSLLTVRIRPKPYDGALELHPKKWENPYWNKVDAGYSNLPVGLWGQYDPDKDPANAGADTSAALTDSSPKTTELLTSLTLYSPQAKRSSDCIAPFNVDVAMRQLAAQKEFPNVEHSEKIWAPGEVDPDPAKQFDDVKRVWDDARAMVTEATVFMAELGLGGWQWDRAKQGKVVAPERLRNELDMWFVEAPCVSAAA